MYLRENWKVILLYVDDKKSLGRLCQCSKLLKSLVETTSNYIEFIKKEPFVVGKLHQIQIKNKEYKFNNHDLMSMRLYLTNLLKLTVEFAVQANDNNLYTNDPYAVPVSLKYYCSKFYLGRCIQYIYERSNILISASLLEDVDKLPLIVELAHDLKSQTILPKLGDNFYQIYCACHSFIVGSDKCRCGRKKLEFCEPIYCKDLDATQLNIGIRDASAHFMSQIFKGPLFDAIGGYILNGKTSKGMSMGASK